MIHLIFFFPFCYVFCSKIVFNNNDIHSSIDNYIKGRQSLYAPINEWNVSQVTDMTSLFDQIFPYPFNDNISKWDVSNVTDMTRMFKNAKNFNQDISYWSLSKVTSMNSMFEFSSEFNQPFFQWWDVSNVKDMKKMFFHALKFNQDISAWDVSNVTNMSWMFASAWEFDQNLSNWEVSNVLDMHEMFSYAWSFNFNLSDWDTSKVTNMSRMFYFAKQFNQEVSNWEVSNVKDMHGMFGRNYEFNHKLSFWNINAVTSLSYMFYYASNFTEDVSNWNTSNVVEMNSLFKKAKKFDQILPWNTENVLYMDGMFADALSFNQPIGNWDTSSVITFQSMFQKAINFNQDIGDWNTRSAKNMLNMFSGAKSFNSMISNWDVSNVTNFNYMFNQCMAFGRSLCWDISSEAEIKSIFTNTNGARFYCYDTPTITPRACLDDPHKKFQLWQKPNLDCNWLKNQKNLSSICDKEPSASESCPDTCSGFCNTVTHSPVPAPSAICNDISWKFTMWGKPNMNCEWLGRRSNLLEICGKEAVARESCPVTCRLCDPGDNVPSTSGSKLASCSDDPGTFTMWGKPNMNCKWIGNRFNTEDICIDQEIANKLCPHTCKSCNNTNIQPKPLECKDSSENFIMWNKPNMSCKWLLNRSNRLEICMNEAVARKYCPNLCDSCNKIDTFVPSSTKYLLPTTISDWCYDKSETFTLWGRPNMNCKWLKKKPNILEICAEEPIVKKLCPLTCDSCDKTYSFNPSLLDFENSCIDYASTFTMWKKENMNCEWIQKQPNKEEICSEQYVARTFCPITCNSCNLFSVSTPNNLPLVTLSTVESCDDSTVNFTMWNKPNMNCKWVSMQKNSDAICRKEQVARFLCPRTCNYCDSTIENPSSFLSLPPTPVHSFHNKTCIDSVNTFTMWGKPNMNCKWLRSRFNTKEICLDQEIARRSCPHTCGVCNIEVDIIPNFHYSSNYDYSCNDLPWTNFTLWNKTNLTCIWLSKQPMIYKLCSENNNVKETCPVTCTGVCKNGLYTDSLLDTNSCTDNYNVKFELSNGENASCKWLARLNNTRQNTICKKEHSLKYNCPDTCRGYCGLSPITLTTSVTGRKRMNLRKSRIQSDDFFLLLNKNSLCRDNLKEKISIGTFVDCYHLSTAIPSDREDFCAKHRNVRQICPDTCTGFCNPID